MYLSINLLLSNRQESIISGVYKTEAESFDPQAVYGTIKEIKHINNSSPS